MPNFAHFSHSGRENSSLRSRVMTSSLSSSRANRRTSLRKAACSSFHAKSKACLSPVFFLAQVHLELCFRRIQKLGWYVLVVPAMLMAPLLPPREQRQLPFSSRIFAAVHPAT